jgi:hypothetical protein
MFSGQFPEAGRMTQAMKPRFQWQDGQRRPDFDDEDGASLTEALF